MTQKENGKNHSLKQRKCILTEATWKWRKCHFYKMWLLNCLLQNKTKESHWFFFLFSFREVCGKNCIVLVKVQCCWSLLFVIIHSVVIRKCLTDFGWLFEETVTSFCKTSYWMSRTKTTGFHCLLRQSILPYCFLSSTASPLIRQIKIGWFNHPQIH